MPSVLTSSQTIYLANIDGAADLVTSQSSERIDFYCDHERADTNIFAYNKFLCDNIQLDGVTIVSPDTDFAVIFLYESVTNLKFLDTIWFKLVLETIRDIYNYICRLLLAMHVMSGCDSVSSFSRIEKIATFQTLKNKIDKLTNMTVFDFNAICILSLSKK